MIGNNTMASSKINYSYRRTSKLTLLAVLLSLALILGYVEHLIPIITAVPGIKLGLSNIVLLICLYAIGSKETITLMFLKVLLSAFLFSGFSMMLYSLAGGILSIIAMIIGKNLLKLSIIGTSVMGGVFHNIGQIALAIIVLQQPLFLYYMGILMLVGIVTGILTGLIAQLVLKHLKVFTKQFKKQ